MVKIFDIMWIFILLVGIGFGIYGIISREYSSIALILLPIVYGTIYIKVIRISEDEQEE